MFDRDGYGWDVFGLSLVPTTQGSWLSRFRLVPAVRLACYCCAADTPYQGKHASLDEHCLSRERASEYHGRGRRGGGNTAYRRGGDLSRMRLLSVASNGLGLSCALLSI